MFKKYRYYFILLVAVVIAFVMTFVPLPYYITKPGSADRLEPYVMVKDGYKEKGNFMLVTVSMSKANITNYLVAKWNKYDEVFPQGEILGDQESDEQYQFRQLQLMQESRNAAILNAYRRANKEVHVENKGALVLMVGKDFPAAKQLKFGDRLTAVDGKALATSDEFAAYMQTKKVGDTISLEYVRNKEKHTAVVPVVSIPVEGGEERGGIGVQITTEQEMKVNPDVQIDSHGIGGPSAGLMFTLEIYNQLTQEDFTKGYQIAGTGTINMTGEIGPIGGISQKIVAADRAGAEIFFAPHENGKEGSNYKEAVKTATEIHSKMIIVGVDTLDQAIGYLETLQKK